MVKVAWPADIICVHSTRPLGRMIEWAERDGDKAWATHIAVVVDRERGNRTPWSKCLIVEALETVQLHKFSSRYTIPPDADQVHIYRPLELDWDERVRIAARAREKVNRLYNYGMIVLQLFDGLLGKLIRRRVVFWRKLGTRLFGEICSVVVSQSYYEATGWTFGLPALAANPDDIEDYCATHPQKYIRLI